MIACVWCLRQVNRGLITDNCVHLPGFVPYLSFFSQFLGLLGLFHLISKVDFVMIVYDKNEFNSFIATYGNITIDENFIRGVHRLNSIK